jgi:hypothetical protein
VFAHFRQEKEWQWKKDCKSFTNLEKTFAATTAGWIYLKIDKIHSWKVGMIYQVIERVGGVNLSKRAALGSPVFPPKRESFCCLAVSQTSPNTGRTCKDICTFSSRMTTEPNSNSWIYFLPQDADNQTHTHVHSLKQNTVVPAQFLISNTFSMCDFQAYNVHIRVCMSGFQHVDEGLDMCNDRII